MEEDELTKAQFSERIAEWTKTAIGQIHAITPTMPVTSDGRTLITVAASEAINAIKTQTTLKEDWERTPPIWQWFNEGKKAITDVSLETGRTSSRKLGVLVDKEPEWKESATL